MNKTILFALLIFVFGCTDLKKGLGLIKDPPDEFLIKKIDPIERPPNYDLLHGAIVQGRPDDIGVVQVGKTADFRTAYEMAGGLERRLSGSLS